MGMALERSSTAAYNSHLNSYLTFCRIHNRPIAPSVDTLSFFIVYMSAHIRPDSVAVYLAGVCNRLENEFPEVRLNRANPIVKPTLAGCLRRARQQPSRKPPLDLTHLHDALRTLSATRHDDLLFGALLTTGFHALMRLGELAWADSVSLQSYRKVVLRRSLCINKSSYSFILPTHKTVTAGHGCEILVSAFSTSVDPLLCIATCAPATPSSTVPPNYGSRATHASLLVPGSCVVSTTHVARSSQATLCGLEVPRPSRC